MLKGSINSVLSFVNLPGEAVSIPNWYEMQCFEKATIVAPVLNMKTLMWRKINYPLKHGWQIGSMICSFIFAGLTQEIRVQQLQDHEISPELERAHPCFHEPWFCCQHMSLFWAVSSLVIANCPKASWRVGTPRCHFHTESSANLFFNSKRKIDYGSWLHCELWVYSWQLLPGMRSLYTPRFKTLGWMANLKLW